MKLYWEGLLDVIKAHLKKADDHIFLMSPFISKGVLEKILPKNIAATIITSWNDDFLVKSPDSIEVYTECKDRPNTALYINEKLHAKLYASDLTKFKNNAVVGSANLTRKGLGVGVEPNYEVLCELDKLNPKDRIYFQRILNNSTLVTDEIYSLYKDWIKECIITGKFPFKPIITFPHEKQLLVTDLPLTDSPHRLWDLKSNLVEFEWWEEDSLIHDLSIFGGENAALKDDFIYQIINGFQKQIIVIEFLKIIDHEGIYFGRIKEWIQNNCHDVPTPKRRELTLTVQALIRWIVELFPDKYEIVRPRHSECLRSKF